MDPYGTRETDKKDDICVQANETIDIQNTCECVSQ